MNLEELKIKVSLDLKDLNKQLNGVSASINKTFASSVKKMAKTTTKEVDVMAKDINKSLNRAFTLDSRKFDADVTRTMNQAKRTVHSACKEIRAELNKAFNIDGHIRVTASSNSKMANSGSNNSNTAIEASSQYTGAMIIKATNAIISALTANNNANTQQTISAIDRATNKIIKALNTTPKATQTTTTTSTIPNKPKTTTKGPQNTSKVPPIQSESSGGSSVKEVVEEVAKVADTINKSLVKQLGSGSYGSNKVQSRNSNLPQYINKSKTTPLKGEIVNPVVSTIPVEPFKQIQDIIEVINFEVKDFETGLVKAGSRALTVFESLKESPLTGEVIDSGKLSQNKGITQKEVIIPASFKVIDDELQEQINDAIKRIKIPKLNTPGSAIKDDLAHFSEELDTTLSELGSIDVGYFEKTLSSLKDWVEPLEEALKKIKAIGKYLDMGDVDIDTSKARSQVDALTAAYEALIDACKTNNLGQIRKLFDNDTSSTASSGGQFPAPPPNKKDSSSSSNKGGKPPRPTTLGFGFGAYKNELEMLGKLANKVFSKIRKAIKVAFNETQGPKKLNDALLTIEVKALRVFRAIKAKATPIFQKIAIPLRNAFNKVVVPIKNVANKITTSFKNAMSKASGLVKGYGRVIRNHLNLAFNGIKSSKLYTNISKALDKAKSAVSKFASKVKPMLNKAFSGIKVGTKVASTISKGLGKALGALKKFANSCKTIWGKIKGIFSKGASDATKATGKLATGLKGLLANALGFFSLYSLISIGKQAIEQSQTLAQSEIKLAALMKQRMGATNDTVEAIRQLVKEQTKLGVVSETAMTRGAEQLSMYVHSAQALKTLLPSIANLTAKRGGFMATEGDAEEVATQLGEAIREGTTTPLEQSGIYLSEKEIEKFKALRTEEARAKFLADEIAKSVGDINKALANTPIGAMTQLKNNFKELLGTLGIFLANVLKPIVQWLNYIVVACNNALKGLGKLLGFDMTGGATSVGDIGTGGSTSIDNVTDAYDNAADAADKATEANEKFKGSLAGFDEINTLSNNTNNSSDSDNNDDPTDITPGLGGQLIPDVGELTESDSIFDKFGDKMKAFMDEVLEPFKNAWAELGDRWIEAWDRLKEKFGEFCDSLARFLKSVWDNGGKEFVEHMAEIALAVGIAAMEIGGTILDALAKLWDHLDPDKNMHTKRLLDVLNEVSQKFKEFILGLNEHFENLLEYGGQDVLNAMGDCFMDLAAAFVNTCGVIIDAVDGLIDHLDPKFNKDTRNMLQATADMFHAVGEAAWDFSELLESALANGGQGMINAFGTCVVNLGETAANIITTMMDSFSEFFDYIDPAKNDITKRMMKSWEDAFYAIGDAALEFADLLESVMKNGGQEVLNSLGDAFNSLLGLVGDVVKEIADALNGLFEHLDPKTNQFTKDMLKAWENAFKGITDMADSLGKLISSSMDNGGQEILNSIGDLGMKLGEAFGVIVEECAKTFSELFEHMNPENNEHSKKMLTSLDGFVDSITGFVDACVEAFQNFMDNGGRDVVKNIGDIVAIIIDLAAELGSGIIDVITAFMDSWVGQALIEGVATALEWVTEKLVNLSDTFDVVKDIFHNIIDVIVGIFEGDGEKVGRAFAKLIKNAFKLTGELTLWLGEVAIDLVKGLVKGICALPELLWEAVKFLFDTIVGFFKELFGIHSPSTVFADLGKNLVEGLVNGITGLISKATKAISDLGKAIFNGAKDIVKGTIDKFKEIKDGVTEKLEETKENASQKWTEMKENASDLCSKIVEVSHNKFSTVKDKLTKVLGETHSSISSKWEDIKKTTSEKCKNIYDDVSTKYSDTKKKVLEILGNVKQDASDKWGEIKTTTSDILTKMKDSASESYDKLRNNLGDTMSKWSENSSKTWNTIKENTSKTVSDLKDNVSKLYEDSKTNVSGTLDKTKEVISNAWDNAKTTTEDKIKKLTDATSNSYNTMKETIGSKLEEVKSKTATKWSEMNTDSQAKVSDIVKNATNKFGEVKNNFTQKLTDAKSAMSSKWNDLKTQGYDSAKGIVDKAKSGLSNIGQTMADAITKGKSNIKSALDTIGNLFKNAKWELPKIKLPSIKVTGEWGFNPPRVPKFSVQWNKRGGIIDGITPLGFANGALQMGGEAGKEMVVPLEDTSFTSKIAQAMGQAVDNAMRRSYNNTNNNNSGVNDNRDVVLKVDGRELARASINNINKLQRESGKTLLDV